MSLVANFEITTAAEFRNFVIVARTLEMRYERNLELLPAEDYLAMICYLGRVPNMHKGIAGMAVTPELTVFGGARKLINVFALLGSNGIGSQALKFITSQYAHLVLDCYDSDGLVPFYKRHGFNVEKRDENWTPGGPDVVLMRYNGTK
ncbi:MAG: hypothetical protein CMH30_06345 [Micavibrio sp.]|nr:hypothetical protein [Micavibrio sp.]